MIPQKRAASYTLGLFYSEETHHHSKEDLQRILSRKGYAKYVKRDPSSLKRDLRHSKQAYLTQQRLIIIPIRTFKGYYQLKDTPNMLKETNNPSKETCAIQNKPVWLNKDLLSLQRRRLKDAVDGGIRQICQKETYIFQEWRDLYDWGSQMAKIIGLKIIGLFGKRAL